MITLPVAANSRVSSFDPSARDRLGSGISRMSRDPGLMLAVLPTAGKRTIRAVGLSRIANTSLHPQPWHRTGSFLQPKCQRLKPGLGQRWVLGQSRTIDHSINNCRGYRFGAIHPHRTPKHQETEQTTRLLSTLEAVIATAIITLLVVFCIYFLGTLAMAEPINASALFLGPPRPAFTVLLGMVGHTISPSTLAHQTFYRASRGS